MISLINEGLAREFAGDVGKHFARHGKTYAKGIGGLSAAAALYHHYKSGEDADDAKTDARQAEEAEKIAKHHDKKARDVADIAHKTKGNWQSDLGLAGEHKVHTSERDDHLNKAVVNRNEAEVEKKSSAYHSKMAKLSGAQALGAGGLLYYMKKRRTGGYQHKDQPQTDDRTYLKGYKRGLKK